eukprot:1000767-Pyramimonas_sp.AAC.1
MGVKHAPESRKGRTCSSAGRIATLGVHGDLLHSRLPRHPSGDKGGLPHSRADRHPMVDRGTCATAGPKAVAIARC